MFASFLASQACILLLASLFAGSNSTATYKFWVYNYAFFEYAHIAQSVEHFLGKEEVTGSNPVMGSTYNL